MGVCLIVDDFGVGYSSFALLQETIFKGLKIDRSFVSSLSEGNDSTTIIQAITSLGEGLGLPITAEGIESQAVLDILQKLGTFKGQGYLYGRPETAHQTRQRLADLGLLLDRSGATALEGTDREVLPTLDDNRRSA